MKRLITTSIAHYEFDYYCTVCSYVPIAGDIVFIQSARTRCPQCGTAFSDEATARFIRCSVDFAKVPNQNYPDKEYDGGQND